MRHNVPVCSGRTSSAHAAWPSSRWWRRQWSFGLGQAEGSGAQLRDVDRETGTLRVRQTLPRYGGESRMAAPVRGLCERIGLPD
jgi:hypothetical protein